MLQSKKTDTTDINIKLKLKNELQKSLIIFNQGKKYYESNNIDKSYKEFDKSLELLQSIITNYQSYQWFSEYNEKIQKNIKYINQYKTIMKPNNPEKIDPEKEVEKVDIEKVETNKTIQIDNLTIISDTKINQSLFNLICKDYRDFITQNVIKPIQYQELYKSNINNILISGKQGTGKSFIIKQTLLELKHYISIDKTITQDILLQYQELKEIFKEIVDMLKIQKYQKKIILIIDNIDIIEEKDYKNWFYQVIFQLLQYSQLFIIATSVNGINHKYTDLLSLFHKRLELELPNIKEIHNYIYYKIYEYINVSNSIDTFDFNNILQNFNKYQNYHIPILNQSIIKLCKKCYDNKASYYDLDHIIDNLLRYTADTTLNTSLFQKIMIHSQTYFINASNYNLKKKENTLVLCPFNIKKIFYQDKPYISYLYSSSNLIIDDEKISNYYIPETINNLKDIKEIDIIVEFDTHIINQIENQEKEHILFHTIKYIVEMYISLIKHIISNISNINHSNKYELNKIAYMLQNLKILNKINSIDDFIFLNDELKYQFYQLIELNHITDNYTQFKDTFHKCLNTHVQHITLSNYQDYHYHLTYANKSSNQIREYINGIPNNETNPNKIKEIIEYLLTDNISVDFEIKVTYLKQYKHHTWTIEIIPYYQKENQIILDLFDINIIDTNKPNEYPIYYDVSPSINIITKHQELPKDYKITNVLDVEILQENFPQDFTELYNDEKESWELKVIHSKHIYKLEEYYNTYQTYFITLYYHLLNYKNKYIDNMSPIQINKLNILINNLEYKVKEILLHKDTYDESQEINEIIWSKSENTNDDIKDTNYNINLLTFKNILSIIPFFDTFQDMFQYYEKTINRDKIDKNDVMFVKSKLNLENIDNYYSSLYLKNTNQIDNNFIKLFIHKLLNHKSFYIDTFINSDKIGYLNKDKNYIQWYSYNTQNQEYIHKYLKSGIFNIQNKSQDFVYKLLVENNESIYINHLLSYLLTCNYTYENNINNYIGLYISIYLYHQSIALPFIINNKLKEDNIIEIINNDIITKFRYIIDRFKIMKEHIKDIVIPEINENINQLFILRDKSDIELNQDNQMNKEYIEKIKKQFNMDMQHIQDRLISFNIKKQYLGDIIHTYSFNNNTQIHKIEEQY